MEVETHMIKEARLWAARGLFMVLAVGAGAPVAAQDQTCTDNVVIACFDGCNDPNNFQECIIGCATGANANPQNCYDWCYEDPLCLSKCLGSVAGVQACIGAQKVDVARGAVVLNRATGVWQQTVRLKNNTLLEPLQSVVLVLDGLAPGWTLTNPDGTSTPALPPAGRAYKEVAAMLEPGQTVSLVLRFTRSGSTPFGYTPMVYVSEFR